jgi:hypothetical protein
VRCKKVVHIEQREERARELGETLYKGRAKVAVDPQGRYSVDPRYGGPEYESLASLGVNLGLDDLIAICKSNEMCNYLAMDTVSLGSTLAWAMECFEKGILTLEDTGGVPLRFHDADGVIKLVEMIAYRQGIGDLLAEGSQRAAQRLGRGSEAFLTTVKGMEMAMHDPRHMPPMRASYLLAPTGGDHMRQTGNRNGAAQPDRALSLPRLRGRPVARDPEGRHRMGHHPGGDGHHGPPRAHPRAVSSTSARASRGPTTGCRCGSASRCPSIAGSRRGSRTRSSPSTTSSRAGTRRPACRRRTRSGARDRGGRRPAV